MVKFLLDSYGLKPCILRTDIWKRFRRELCFCELAQQFASLAFKAIIFEVGATLKVTFKVAQHF